MTDSKSSANPETSPHIEKLLDSANSASQTVAALHVTFIAFITYLGVIVWGTKHEDLLRISPVNLPILDVELPLTTFYAAVPWMMVLLHFNLLMQLELLSCKLWNLDRDLPDTPAGQQIRDRLFIFPFTHLIVGRSGVWLIRWLLSLVVGITVIALPLFMLLAAQIRFLPFHDETITWSQRIAVWCDAIMLLALWPLIASPQDRAREWWQNSAFKLLGYWPASLRYVAAITWNRLARSIKNRWPEQRWRELVPPPVRHPEIEPKGMIVLLISVPLVVLLSLVAVVPGSTTVQTYYQLQKGKPEESPKHFEDWLIRKVPESWLSVAVHQYDRVSCTTVAEAEKSDASILQIMLGPCSWFNLGLFPRHLILREARLVPKEVPMSLLARATDPDKPLRDAAFKEFDGLNLRRRDLRFADLYGAVLPKADIRQVQLQGAILLKAKLQGAAGWDKTQLQGAILGGTQLQSAQLIEANLQIADLRGADLRSADLGWTNLQSADLRGVDLQGVNLRGAKLQGADLRGAKLQGAILHEANLQGADLSYTNLQGADLTAAQLQDANLREAQLQGSDWTNANVAGVFIAGSSRAEWNATQQRKLEIFLKPLLDIEQFGMLQARIKHAGNGLLLGEATGRQACYSDDRNELRCQYANPTQLDTYRNSVLHPQLVQLACSDATVAVGIVRRGFNKSADTDPDFRLSAALLKTLNSPKPCIGLAALPEPLQQKLRDAERLQGNVAKNR